MNEKIVSALVGLSGACGNNGKTEHTDEIVGNALLHCFEPIETALEADIVSEIRTEKFRISPNCETCPTPCGNTSDYDMQNYHDREDLKPIKEELLKEAVALLKNLTAAGITELPEEIYRAISYFSYALAKESYQKLIDTLKQMVQAPDFRLNTEIRLRTGGMIRQL